MKPATLGQPSLACKGYKPTACSLWLHRCSTRTGCNESVLQPFLRFLCTELPRSIDAQCLSTQCRDQNLRQLQAAIGSLCFQILHDGGATTSFSTNAHA